ncbi:MAG: group III truncated hemoglobin [Rhodocyclaceae bacterium]|nr:group III truncated hemoglobin [Rhodocyclaceae bacterium]MCB1910262.1 group III truncated hemoglobin [Rhodocyclaceae bacterium]MCP5239227.1 group III truncated hemoglobin [Zoogloeaceae bacterium]MCP5255813.1 group III truncated hemoglobin [Zoogloeaceae bacterium]MCW5615458.1 group III truncated hemoglobin [Rhodocyclaceae bacterium]
MSDSDSSTPLNRQALHELVHAFYADVRRDPSLGPVFDAAIGAHWDTHLERMVEFWSTMMLDTRGFAGNVYGTHMKLEGVEPAHFERWMTLWYRHTAHGFKAMDRQRLRETAGMIGRSLFFGFFSASARFIADEQGRVRIERG